MGWGKDFGLEALLHHPALMHYHDLIGDRLHRCNVVGDEQIGYPGFLLKPQEKLEDAFLDDLVEGGGNFIANDEVRLGGKRPGNRDALLLAAGHLARQSVHEVLAELDSHRPQEAPNNG